MSSNHPGSSSEVEPAAILQLPYLCQKEIFSWLGLRDLAVCRSVCRLFKSFADERQEHELVVDKPLPHADEGPNWFLTNRPINLENLISWELFLSLSLSPSPIVQQLKFLCIHLDLPASLRFERLNVFKRLVHLEVRSTSFAEVSGEKLLNLPNLRVFCLRNLIYSSLVLKTPRLEALQCHHIERVEIGRPRNIRSLACDYSNATVMAKFKKLELFRCDYVAQPGLLKYFLGPSGWKHLKSLEFVLNWKDYGAVEYAALKKSLGDLLNQKALMRNGEKLIVHLNDALFFNVDQLLPYDLTKDPLNFYLKNYLHLRASSYPKVTQIDYVKLMGLIGRQQLSSDFFDKFPSIQTVEVKGAVNSDQLRGFLKNVGHKLRRLILTNTSPSEAFLNCLPDINDRLTHLTINDRPDSAIRFDFILQLTRLEVFETNQQFDRPLELAERMFHESGNLEYFQFDSSQRTVEIRREFLGEDSFSLTFETERRGGKFSFDTHLNWVELEALYEKRNKGEMLIPPPIPSPSLSLTVGPNGWLLEPWTGNDFQ